MFPSEFGEISNKLKKNIFGQIFEMLVTVLAVFVTNIVYLLTLASGTDIQKMPPKDATNIKKNCHQHKVTNIFVAQILWNQLEPIYGIVSVT